MATSFSARKSVLAATHRPTNAELDGMLAVLSQTHMFDLDRLLAWLESLTSNAFWAADSDDAIAYPAPAQAYLDEVFYPAEQAHYQERMRLTSRLLWEVRNQQTPVDPMTFGVRFRPVMEAALMVLTAQIDHLRALQYFCGDGATDDVANMTPILMRRDSEPDLQDFCYEWLSFHLRYFAQEYWEELAVEKKVVTMGGKGAADDSDYAA